MKRIGWALLVLGTLALAQPVALQPVVSQLDKPLYLTQEPGGPLLVVTQRGQVFFVDAKGRAQPWLDLRKKVSCCGERGLLGLAFHPNYAKNHRFFVNYTDRRGRTVIEEYRNQQPYRVLLTIKQPYANHNGGHLAFGPDGYLYIGTGDGGSAGDPQRNAQNPASLLGKMLRIDVDRGNPYAIPEDNPFVDNPKYRPEIWALGLRNPWRYSFDRATGDLFIADVGQNRWEEVDFVPAPMNTSGGWNFGWNVMEGNHCFKPPKNCRRAGLVPPILEYGHDQGCSITGGYVYRGQAIPELVGAYLFGDYCSGTIWTARWENGAWTSQVLLRTKLKISSFGEDAAGELYVVDYGGTVYRIVPAR
ncbi:PQQ-dependent sugar dehydrogenase [Oceanithermus sp.]|uniref:PQQ-dependent sugar dehydrogenase n=1 Tax=Oceanithermus sp. TaxID=2268145 RepID=UPI0025EBAE32|nr:PQQ-dependent sugar dehydrogenase [Oceanithermus sp.]